MTRFWAVRPRWRTEILGEFFCPGCGGDRNFRRQRGRRWGRLLGMPVLPLGAVATSVQCTACSARFGLDALDRPTCTRLSAMLRDAQYTIALAALAAGGVGSRSAREAACALVREAGFDDCGEAQVLAALAALTGLGGTGDTAGGLGGLGGALTVELHAALEPLAPHLAPQGLERLLHQGAWIALADGPYTPDEREALTAVGSCLALTHRQIDRLLTAAAGAQQS